MDHKTRYFRLLSEVERPSRYIGDEFGQPPVPTGSSIPRVALGFADVYEVGMSHLGFRLLHATLADRDDVQVERVFLPWPDLQRRLQESGLPLSSLETFTPVAGFDLLGLSVQYELALPSVLKLLDLSGIPRDAARRAAEPTRWPLVLVGGTVALNPEPLAPFVDAFFVGEADRAIHEVVSCLRETDDRALRLERLAGIRGTYLPGRYRARYPGAGAAAEVVPIAADVPTHIERRWVGDLERLDVPRTHLVPHCAIVHDRVAVEIQRGCCQGCRFCQAGFTTRPTRQRSADRVLELARRQLEATGYQDLSLLSLSAGDHPALQPTLAALLEEHSPSRVAVSLPSMRTETLHPTIAEQISRVRRTTFTLAPEAATDRLRRVINKGNTEADLMASVEAVARAGYSQFKLYFMIGLPTETDEDLLAIAGLSRRVLESARDHAGPRASLTVSISTFVPKPHTPFQWAAACDLEEIRRRQALVVGATPRRIRLKWHDPGQSVAEAVLARGDRRMAAVLERVVDQDSPGLDAWTEHFSWERWRAALDEAHRAGELPALDQLLGQRAVDQPLPWAHIDVGVGTDYLRGELEAALAEKWRPDCADGECDACGVCPDLPLHRLAPQAPRTTTAAAQVPPSAPWTVRLWFSKRDRARLLSHLEMAGVFERAARRAGLPLWFSAGFNPKAKLTFSPALALGAESECEYLELRLSGAMELAEVVARLGPQLPPGLALGRAEVVRRSLARRIVGIRWRFELGEEAGRVLEQGRRRLGDEGLTLERRNGRSVVLAREVTALEPRGDDAVEVTCRLTERGTLRPAELLLGLLGLDGEAAGRTRIVRAGWVLSEDEASGAGVEHAR